MTEQRKRRFLGEEELDEYIGRNKRKHSLQAFARYHENDIPSWSVRHEHSTGSQMFGLWKRRYMQCLVHHRLPFDFGVKTKDIALWDKLSQTTQALANTKTTYKLYGIKALNDAAEDAYTSLTKASSSSSKENEPSASSSSSEATEPSSPSSSSKATEPCSSSLSSPSSIDRVEPYLSPIDTSISPQASEPSSSSNDRAEPHLFPNKTSTTTPAIDTDDMEYLLHKIYRKNSLDKHDLDTVTTVARVNGENVVMSLMTLAAKFVLEDNATPLFKDAIVKLSMSRIINRLNIDMDQVYENHFTKQDWAHIKTEYDKIDVDIDGSLSTDSVSLLNRIFKFGDDTDAIIDFLDQQRTVWEKQSQTYTVILIVDQIIRNLPRWSKKIMDSEICYYRRFAAILDILLDDTDIIMVDGEHVSHATKANSRLNKTIFDDTDGSSASYGRKIDLILACNDETVELSSNEWKMEKTRLALKQQSKNLRVNAQIINHSHVLDQVVAMDFVGNTGYLYILKKTRQDFFLARPVARMVIPKKIQSLHMIKTTLAALFFLKDYLVDASAKLQQASIEANIDNALPDLNLPRYSSPPPTQDLPYSPSTYIFSTPKKNRIVPVPGIPYYED